MKLSLFQLDSNPLGFLYIRRYITIMKLKLIILSSLSIFLLSGCASYKAQSLEGLNSGSSAYSEEKSGVKVSLRAFTPADCKRYFDRPLIQKGYQPIQIAIENKTNNYILFSEQAIDMPVVPSQEVADKVHSSMVGQALAFGVLGIISASQANDKLDRDFDSKVSDGQNTIMPYGRYNGVIFVSTKNYRNHFTLSLVNCDTKEQIEFQVNNL